MENKNNNLSQSTINIINRYNKEISNYNMINGTTWAKLKQSNIKLKKGGF